MKKAKAKVNQPVFTYVSEGVWSGKVFGYEVTFEKAMHKHWECRVADGVDAGKLLAAAETRSKALIEAYHNVLKAEQNRLDWVLADEPLRTYGKRGQYNTDIDLGEKRKEHFETRKESQPQLSLVKDKYEPEEDEEESRIPGKLTDFLTVEQKLRIRQFYKIRKDHVAGKGFYLVKFNSDGIYETGHGPYPTAGEAYEKILEIEGVEIPEQE